ncbi:ankyrin repeat-containing domain protein [Xylaria acuta]|nr:ankyrin repeat-containing domain protein [Xylaria acuta]
MNALVPARPVQELDLAVSNFCAILTDDQRHDLSNIRNIPDADSIFVFTAQLDYKNRSRRGQSVGSRVSKVLQSTRDFCAVVDTCVSSHPEIAALVWGSVKLTIQIVLNYTSYYEAISGLFLQLGHLCPLFAEYGALYPSSKPLQKSLSDFHAAIVRCCKHVIEAIQRPWHGQVLQAFYRSFEQEFQPDVDDIRRCSDSVKDAINLAGAHIDAQERKLQAKERTAAFKHRGLLKTVLKKQSHDRKQQLLEAFCSHRPEKLLKQNQRNRFSNTASWIVEIAEFRSWIDTSDLPLLWCSGYSASVVDYLFLEKGRSDCLLSYFFIDSSDRESLMAETIMKSILRQRLPPAAQLSDKAEERLRRLNDDSDLDGIITFLRDITYTSAPSYIVIDGLDECERPDRVRLLQALSSLVGIAANTRLFLAGRESLTEEIRTHFPTNRQISMDNPGAHDDMGVYIHGILREKINMGELRVGESGLITEIENALSQGADGMFLWVFFQVQELCEQTCDEDIRHTISNLPEDLEETFRRVLRRISSRRNSELARRAFPWIAAAVRPLSIEEVREAIAIEIGQQYTKPERLCNNVHSIISSCENLLHIDEEDGSVQFAHHSIKQFLVEQPVPHQHVTDHDLRVFHIDLEEADHFIGEICVTYLHFSDVQTALSQLPKAIALPNPQDIALTALGSKWNLASKLRQKIQSRGASPSVQVDRLIKPRAGATWEAAHNNKHPFLKYASTNWIIHTKNFRDNKSKTWNLWKRIIISGHALAIAPWQPEASSTDTHIHEWAIQAKHLAILYLIDSSGELWRPTGWQVICEAIEDNNEAIIDIELPCRKPGGVASYIVPECPAVSSLDIVEKLLAAGADVNATGWGLAALREAARNGYVHVARILLLIIGPPVEPPGPAGTLLIEAAGIGQIDIIETILAAGADIDLYGLDLGFLFSRAIDKGRLDVAETILKGGNVDMESLEVKHAFRNAAGKGYFDIVERLLTAGASAYSSWNSETALHMAVTHGHLDIAERLLAAGAKAGPNAIGWRRTLLFEAIEMGYRNITETLLIAGADVNVIDREGRTALYGAVQRGDLTIIERLLAAEADINIQDREGRTALCGAVQRGYLNIIERLLTAGANVNIQDRYSRTALYGAVQKRDLTIVEQLLAAGADVNIKDREGRTALYGAVERGDLNIVERLLAAGPDVNIVEQLLAAGADVNIKDRKGRTALYGAVERGDLNIVERLLAAGPDVNIQDRDSKTALYGAVERGDLNIVERLLAAGADPLFMVIQKFSKGYGGHIRRQNSIAENPAHPIARR